MDFKKENQQLIVFYSFVYFIKNTRKYKETVHYISRLGKHVRQLTEQCYGKHYTQTMLVKNV